MKFVRKFLMFLAFISSGNVLAGEAIIPYWSTYLDAASCFHISNVTNTPVYFKFTLYDESGSNYTGAIQWTKNITALDQEELLAANSTAEFCLVAGSNDVGYGRIKTRDETGEKGNGHVVARGFGYSTQQHVRGALISINNSMPF